MHAHIEEGKSIFHFVARARDAFLESEPCTFPYVCMEMIHCELIPYIVYIEKL